MFNIQNMVTEQTLCSFRINFLNQYIASLVKCMFNTHVKIWLKINAQNNLMDIYRLQTRIDGMLESSLACRKPKGYEIMKAKNVIKDMVKVITQGDIVFEIYNEIELL